MSRGDDSVVDIVLTFEIIVAANTISKFAEPNTIRCGLAKLAQQFDCISENRYAIRSTESAQGFV